MKTTIYLLFLLLLIMASGARTMFEIAYNGATREHNFAPDHDTSFLIGVAIWFILMMVFDVLLLRNKQLPKRNLFIALLSVAIFVPAIYMYVTHR